MASPSQRGRRNCQKKKKNVLPDDMLEPPGRFGHTPDGAGRTIRFSCGKERSGI